MKKIVKKFHLYFALILFLPLIIQGLTGSLLVLKDIFFDGEVPNFFRTLKKFHASLLLPSPWGKSVVGVFGLVLIFMCVSGLVIWWPKPGFLKHSLRFKFSSTGKKFHRDLHGAIGFWMLIPLTAASVTGIYLIYFKTKQSNKLWHAIHEGSFGGATWQLIVFLTGFLPLLFSITGIALWWMKKRDKKLKFSAKI